MCAGGIRRIRFMKEKIREAALRLLDRQDYTVREMRRKLIRKSFDADEVDDVLAELESCGFLDDARYASLYAESKLRSGKGRTYISSKLKEKGVDESIIKQTIEDNVDTDTERLYCLKKALSVCGLSQRFTVTEGGEIVPFGELAATNNFGARGSFESPNDFGVRCSFESPNSFEESDFERVNYFEPKDEATASDRALAYKYREKEKAKLARRLISAGYSAGMAFDAIRKISEL